MPLPITCDCGARFDADEALAGKETTCPECHEPVSVAAADASPPLTSLLALSSAVLTLVGAFTVVGTAVAALLGLAGLVQIARSRGRLAGTGLATFGVVAGAALTVLTLFALSSGELLGLGSPTHLGLLAHEVNTTGPLEVVVAEKGFAVTRPSVSWGRAIGDDVEDVVVSELLDEPDLLLVQPARYLFVEVRVAANGTTLDRCADEVLNNLRAGRHDVPLFVRREVRPTVRETRQLPAEGWAERRELVVDVQCGSQPWTILVRLQKSADGEVYITRAYTQRRRFAHAQLELQQALDSFRLVDGK
jgi:hypothetical protein